MTKFETEERRSQTREWVVAIIAVAAWFLLATNAADAQTNQVPDIVLAQVLGTQSASAQEATPKRPVESMAGVNLVAHQMQSRFEDQLVAGVSRPTVELEVHFEFDSDQIQDASRPQIEAAAQVLNQSFPGTRFLVAGYTDALGDDGYNQELSERRAEAVWRELVNAHGVTAERLERIGYGEDDPAAEPGKPADAQRRRVELQILRRGGRSF